jgi:hypothetical protein
VERRRSSVNARLMKAAPDHSGACEGRERSGCSTLGLLKVRLAPSAMQFVPAKRSSAAFGVAVGGHELVERRLKAQVARQPTCYPDALIDSCCEK